MHPLLSDEGAAGGGVVCEPDRTNHPARGKTLQSFTVFSGKEGYGRESWVPSPSRPFCFCLLESRS